LRSIHLAKSIIVELKNVVDSAEQEQVEIYSCVFCGNGIASGALDPCAIHVIGNFDRPRTEQKEQTFFCHIKCLQNSAAIPHANFYILEPDFPTVGDLDDTHPAKF
jgi:hypothetical protein